MAPPRRKLDAQPQNFGESTVTGTKKLINRTNRNLVGAMMYNKRLIIDTRTPSSMMKLCFARALACLGGGQSDANTGWAHCQLVSLQSQCFHNTKEVSKSDSHEQGNVWHVPRQSGRVLCEKRGFLPRFLLFPRTQQLPSCSMTTSAAQPT